MKSIDATENLSVFRGKWTGLRVLSLLSEHQGRALVSWTIGVGKSTNIDQVVETAIKEERYDLVVVLAPTRRILEERAWVRSPPQDVVIVNLRPRPAALCGPLDNLWPQYESNNLGGLGRKELCDTCTKRQECHWPRQFGTDLAGSQVIYATQAHLERSPVFLMSLKFWCKADRVLVILDEANFVMKPARRRIDRVQLQQLLQLFQDRESKKPNKTVTRWKHFLQTLLAANTRDLESGNWYVPFLYPNLIHPLQESGRNRWGGDFCFMGYELQLMGRALPTSREFDSHGNLHFSVYPQIPGDFLIYSGSAHHALAQHRLGSPFASPFAEYRFFHPGTRWYNISSRIGMQRYFRRNAKQIYDFFAQLITARLRQGKQVLLVAKKRFIPLCKDELQKRLSAAGVDDAEIIFATDALPDTPLQASNCVPIINYGMIGTNRFEHFDCCYCLTGFYVDERTLHDLVQDLYRKDLQLGLGIKLRGAPLRRQVQLNNPRQRYTEVGQLAQGALEYLEMGSVLQAVGRVRPYTKPREVITFQCADHPDAEYDQDFQTLGEARTFFGVLDQRAKVVLHNRDQVQQCKSQGLTQKLATERTGLSLSTIKRYWNVTEGVTNPTKYSIRSGDTLPKGESCN